MKMLISRIKYIFKNSRRKFTIDDFLGEPVTDRDRKYAGVTKHIARPMSVSDENDDINVGVDVAYKSRRYEIRRVMRQTMAK